MAEQQEMELHRTYEIRTIADFAQIPKDRIRACLDEFGTALEMQGATSDLLNAVADEMYGAKDAIRVVMDEFRWIDDNAGTIEITIKTPDDKETEIAMRAQDSQEQP